MKQSVKIIFGKEQVNKYYNEEPFTADEKQINVKEFYFRTEAEKNAFCKGVSESVGWTEYCFFEEKLNTTVSHG